MNDPAQTKENEALTKLAAIDAAKKVPADQVADAVIWTEAYLEQLRVRVQNLAYLEGMQVRDPNLGKNQQ